MNQNKDGFGQILLFGCFFNRGDPITKANWKKVSQSRFRARKLFGQISPKSGQLCSKAKLFVTTVNRQKHYKRLSNCRCVDGQMTEITASQKVTILFLPRPKTKSLMK